MIRVNFKVSYPLLTGILNLDYNESEMESEIERVKLLVSSNTNKIVDNLELITSSKLELEEIDIFLVKGMYPSIINPNLLNVNKDDDLVLFDFVYILTHNLFVDLDYYDHFISEVGIDERSLEASIYYVVKLMLSNVYSKKFANDLFAKMVLHDPFIEYLIKDVESFEKGSKTNTFIKHINTK